MHLGSLWGGVRIFGRGVRKKGVSDESPDPPLVTGLSSVYSCILDASKAFDRVNHSKLFDTLVKRGVPLYIIRIMRFWYTSQTMYVRWNNVMSSGFKVTNGVRQGGILSPYLFCVYADELSRMLNNLNAGCLVGESLVIHLMYADDLVLLAPSAAGLSLLLSACSCYGIEFDVKFNSCDDMDITSSIL